MFLWTKCLFAEFYYLYMWLLRCPFYGREQPFYLAQPQISTKFDEIFNRDSQMMIFCSNGKVVLKVKNDCWWRHHKLKNCFFMSFLSRQPVAFGVLFRGVFFSRPDCYLDILPTYLICARFFGDPYLTFLLFGRSSLKTEKCWKSAKKFYVSILKIGVWFAMFPKELWKTNWMFWILS